MPHKPSLSVRKPPAPAVEDFIANGPERPDVQTHSLPSVQPSSPASAQALKRPATQAPKRPGAGGIKGAKPRGPGLVQRRSGRVRRRLTVYLEPATARSLSMYAAGEGVEISDVIEEAVQKHLAKAARRRA